MNTAIRQAIVYLPPADLVDSPFQPKGRSEEGIDELAASIKELGILEPLVVRRVLAAVPFEEIVIGHRRQRAALRAEIVEVPCIVRDMTEDDARLIIAVENTQRLELDALSEAEIIAPLNGPSLAQRLGRGERYTLKRLSLLRLSEDARTALVEGKITLGAAEHLATLADPDAAKEALKHLLAGSGREEFEPVGARAARELVNRYRLRLVDAPWQLQDTTLGTVACVGCGSSSEAQISLFDDANVNEARCLDRACYGRKEKLFYERKADENSEREDDEEIGGKAPSKNTSTKPPLAATKPVIDYERQAREAAIEKALPLIAKRFGDHKRKLDDLKTWKLIAVLLLRSWRSSYVDVCVRRGLGLEANAYLTIVGTVEDPHEVAGLVVELLCVSGIPWSGVENCDSAIAAAAKFTKVDLSKLRSDALLELQNEAKPPQKQVEPKSAAAIKTVAPAFAVDDRVRVRKPSPHAGRTGKIESVFTMNGAERAFVVLDVNDKEKTPKAPSILMKDLELETPPSAIAKEEPKATFDPQSVVCPTCSALIGAQCTKNGGGYHATRTKAASDSAMEKGIVRSALLGALAAPPALGNPITPGLPSSAQSAETKEIVDHSELLAKKITSTLAMGPLGDRISLVADIWANTDAELDIKKGDVEDAVESLIKAGTVHTLPNGWLALQTSLPLPTKARKGSK